MRLFLQKIGYTHTYTYVHACERTYAQTINSRSRARTYLYIRVIYTTGSKKDIENKTNSIAIEKNKENIIYYLKYLLYLNMYSLSCNLLNN
jgi:hypothetical protein